jgi:PAS domain S-box-containing protein
LQALGLASHLVVPLRARGRIAGVLTLATAESGRTLGHEELALVQKISGIAGFALDNARLYRSTRLALESAEEARQQTATSELALGHQRMLLKTIIDAVPALVAYIGPDGRYRLHNEKYQEWLGLGVEDIEGKTVLELTNESLRDGVATHLSSALNGETVRYENPIQAGPLTRHMAATLRPDRDDAGRVCGVVFHAYDITDRKKAYAELAAARELLRCHAEELEARVRQRTATLRETNAELEAFTYSVSHDLRTPLQFVRSFAEAVVDDPANTLSPESEDYLRRILRAATRMDTIIQDLLGYSRLARSEMQLTSIPLGDMISDVATHHQAAIQRAGARVEVEPHLPAVRGDRTGLFQALSNLVSNALKFTVPGRAPVIRIRADETPERVRLWVEDNGIGIAPHHHEKIFKLFERLHGPTEYPGTGIGLSLVRKAVNRMGGTCGVESAPGAGSRFWLDFPKSDGTVVVSNAPAHASA